MTDALAKTVAAASGDETAASLSPRVRTPSLAPGTHVGRYELAAKLGAGGMGVVYRARDPKLARDVAVKLVAVNGLADAQARLEREAQAMAKLSHPNVCTVHDIGAWNEQLFVAMELCTGGTLTAWLRERHHWREIVRALVAAGRGLAAAHALGIVHRDFKPDNVMRTGDGLVKVTDFGLARTSREVGDIEGTPAYMAPEQLSGGEVDARGDQFAFAVTAWQALCGALPFQPDPSGADVFDRMLRAIKARRRVRASDAVVPARIVAIIARGLEADPKDRWPSLEAMLDALERAARPRTRYAIAGALLAIAGVAATAIVLGRPDPPLLFPRAETGLHSKALGPLFALANTIESDTVAAGLLHAYDRSGDADYLYRAAEIKVRAHDVRMLNAELDCSGVDLLRTYRTLRPNAAIDSDLLLIADNLAHMCSNQPAWMKTKDPVELDLLVGEAERDGDMALIAPELHRLIELQPDQFGHWKRLADDYVNAGYCKSARVAYGYFETVAPDGAKYHKADDEVLSHCEQVEDEDVVAKPVWLHN